MPSWTVSMTACSRGLIAFKRCNWHDITTYNKLNHEGWLMYASQPAANLLGFGSSTML